MSAAGWYPDPGGTPGQYRYWDGTSWSTSVVRTPPAPLSAPASPTSGAAGRRRPSPKGLAWWALIGVLVVALIWGGSQLLRAGGLNPFLPAPNSNPTANPCPKPNLAAATIAPTVTGDGRVRGGKLSYPMLPSPWSPPDIETRLVFGRGVAYQAVTVEAGYRPDASWVASVVVGELVAGDGFIAPKEGTDLVVRCAIATFYDDAVVTRDDRVSKAVTISGKPGWLLETHLSFDIRGLNEKGETAIFLIVQTSDTSSSIFYASIPDSRPELLTDARRVQSQLRVEP